MKMEQFYPTSSTAATYVKRSTPMKAPKPAETNSFLYVGKDFNYTNTLMEGFSSSYYFESFIAALKVLPRLANSNHMPDFILFEGDMNKEEIELFLQKLTDYSSFQQVPVLAEIRNCSAEQKRWLATLPGIDDMILIEGGGAELKTKVDFLIKTKKTGSHYNLEQNLETSPKVTFSVDYFLKRSFDVLVSGVLILLLSPLFLLIAALVALESRGPIFYISKRAGRGYKVFNFYKFRTMVAGADRQVSQLLHLNQYGGAANQPVFFKVSNDPRITRFGKFLRNSSLDELPQLFNVFLGDMSLVGNRPLPLYEAETLTSDACAARFLAPAGITGLWQIKKRGTKDMSVEERINLDIEYASNHSFLYDIQIMVKTPSALLQKENV